MACTEVTLCTAGLYPLRLQDDPKIHLPGFKLYAGGSWLAWVRLSSYLNVGLCDRGKDSGLGWLWGTLEELTYKVCVRLQHHPQHPLTSLFLFDSQVPQKEGGRTGSFQCIRVQSLA